MSQTPGPTTRARASASRGSTPQPATVPAIGVGQSFTYGAPGKAVLRTQVASESTSLTSVLQKSRAKATKTPTRAQAIVEEEEEEEEEEPVAAAASGRSRSQPSRDAMPPTTSAAARQDASEIDRSGTAVDSGLDYEPGRLRVTASTIPRYVPQVLRDMFKDVWSFLRALAALLAALLAVSLVLWVTMALALFFLFGFVSLVRLPPFVAPAAEHFWTEMNRFAGNGPYSLPPSELERLWITFRYQHAMLDYYPDSNITQFGINIAHLERIEDLEARVKTLEIKVGIHNDTLQMLQDVIPRSIVLRKTNDQFEIPEVFWRALHQKLSSDDDDSAPLWQAFLQSNKQQLTEINEAAARSEINSALDERSIVSRDMFKEAISENFATMEAHFGEQLRDAERLMLTKMHEEADRTTKEAISRSPAHQLSYLQAQALSYANLVKNLQDSMNEINYAAPGLGAIINPLESSKTYEKKASFLQRFYASPHPPIKALQRWDEAGDCWCAAPSDDKGKAQLSIMLGHKIFPRSIIVEHMPPRGTLQINAAPRDLEVWLETKSPKRAKELAKIVEEIHWGGPCVGGAPSSKHICIGKGTYDIHGPNWVQEMWMYSPGMRETGMGSDKIVVKVVSNWGADWTCLYRLRILGERVDPRS